MKKILKKFQFDYDEIYDNCYDEINYLIFGEKKLLEFNKERKEMNEKIDSLNIEKTKLSQEISKKIEIINKLNATIKDKDNELNDSKKEYDTAIDRIINKFETYKQKQQDVINENNIKKMEYQREIKVV